jgi:2-methylfumaryl-CoA hydratase
MSKTPNPGNFFEDFTLGQVIEHATPRTVTEGDRALYGALYPTRFALPSSAAFAASCGLSPAPVEELIGFHIAFGKTVPDVSLNAVANLGYAECRFHRPVRHRRHPAHPLRGHRPQGELQRQDRRGLRALHRHRPDRRRGHRLGPLGDGHKRDQAAPAPETVVPDLAKALGAADLVLPDGLDFTGYDFAAAGEPHRWDDYEVGEKIDHVDGVTLTDAEHMLATRLWQNTAKVHFNTEARPDGNRLIYGGHIISMARALSFNGLANAQLIAAINAGAHTSPAFAGDTVYAWSEVLDKAETTAPGVGALRLRLVATKGRDESMTLRGDDGKYAPGVLLDLDLWALCPR